MTTMSATGKKISDIGDPGFEDCDKVTVQYNIEVETHFYMAVSHLSNASAIGSRQSKDCRASRLVY